MENTRVDKTKRSFSNALMYLLRSSEMNDITVSSLCRRAHLNRSTFYAHYRNVQDVLDQLKNDVIDRLFQLDQFPYLDEQTFVQFIRYNRELFDVLTKNSDFLDLMIACILKRIGNGTTNASMSTTFAVYGFVGLVTTAQKGESITDDMVTEFMHEISLKLRDYFIGRNL